MATVENSKIASLFKRPHITILVADSGLGGMGIFADIVARLKTDPIFSKVSLIYYNAWPEQGRGYNSLKTMNERVGVFDQALEGMKRFHPDLIMIACNTLSTLYARTAFSRRETVPVLDIIGFGVNLVHAALTSNAKATALLMGTRTTIASEVHRSQLVARGLVGNRLVAQSCHGLATLIEQGPASGAVKNRIDAIGNEIAAQFSVIPSDLFSALLCTHFGYSRDLIEKRLVERLQRPLKILDPNRLMADYLFEMTGIKRYDGVDIDLRVVSRIVWDQNKIDAIAPIIEKQSAQTAHALRAYERIPDLFSPQLDNSK